MDAIRFPNLGISLPHVGRMISIGPVTIAFYGIMIALAMLAGVSLVLWLARRTGQDQDQYFDLAFFTIIIGVIGARLYYVVFSWDYYGPRPLEILNLRGGGLAIYGGVIGGAIAASLFAVKKKMGPLRVLDTIMPGVALGQAIGRWGNFFNREAFGGWTNGLFAMELPADAVRAAEITEQMRENMVVTDGITCIRVHPTFLYESCWNLLVLAVLLLVTLRAARGKRFDGDVFLLYLICYGAGRFIIEGLRTDQLLLWNGGPAVSQVLSAVFVLAGAGILVWRHVRGKAGSGDR